jgi:hypothetical protein
MQKHHDRTVLGAAVPDIEHQAVAFEAIQVDLPPF